MPGFMEGYGVEEARRGRLIKRLVLGGLALIILATGGYYYFRTWRQERIVDDFLAAVRAKDFDRAYAMWCTPQKPCPYYPKEKFMEDWAPPAPYANTAAADVQHVDFCDAGVVFDFAWGSAPPIALWVERSNGIISFAPWQRCPGPHLQLGAFFKRLFGSDQPPPPPAPANP